MNKNVTLFNILIIWEMYKIISKRLRIDLRHKLRINMMKLMINVVVDIDSFVAQTRPTWSWTMDWHLPP